MGLAILVFSLPGREYTMCSGICLQVLLAAFSCTNLALLLTSMTLSILFGAFVMESFS